MRRSVLHIVLHTLLLGGCKAEDLGVRLPPSGPQAISLEDIERDIWALAGPQTGSRAAGQPGAVQSSIWVQQRLSQMSTVPGYGQEWALPLEDGRAVVCAQRDGKAREAVVVLAIDEGEGANRGAVPGAALIGLAKTWAGHELPAYTLVFCMVPVPGGLEAYAARPVVPLDLTLQVFTLGPLGDGALQIDESALFAEKIPLVRIASEGVPAAGEADEARTLDYRRVLDRVREARDRVAAALRRKTLHGDKPHHR